MSEFTFNAPLRDNIERELQKASLEAREPKLEEPRRAYSLRLLGDAVLHAPTKRVETPAEWEEVGELLKAMEREMRRAWTSGVGLSANQVGSNLRVAIAVFGTVGAGGAKMPGQLVHMVNPTIVDRSENVMPCSQEGCLSVPHFRTSRVRHSAVIVRYQTPAKVTTQKKLTGFDAQIAQHELEHLDGVILCDGSTRQQKRAAARAVAKYLERQK